MSPLVLLGAVLQVGAFCVVGWSTSEVVLRSALKRHSGWAGLPERALFGIAGFVVFASALMVANVITGGAVFGTRYVVPIAALALLWSGRRRIRLPHGIQWLPVGALAAVLIAIYLVPAVAGGSSVRTGDPPWHLGWSQQLLEGEPIPTGPAPEYSRNAYPWGWHAVIASTVRLVPGTDPLIAHEALQMVLLLAVPLAAAALARRVRSDAGWWAAAAATLIGGFGWIVARGADFVTTPTQARYGADLVVASPNSVYELFPPALPREMGLVVLAAAGVAVAWARVSKETRVVTVAGVLVGVVGLVSVPLFVGAVVWVAAAWLATRGSLRDLAVLAGCAGVVFGFWAGPVVAAYLRYGGFVNITPQLGKEWDLTTSLLSWGLLLPLALAGAYVCFRGRTVEARAVMGFVAGTALLLALSVARGSFDWALAGNPTILHQGRVWPPAHLLGAACAGVAIAAAWAWGRDRRRRLAPLVAGAILVTGAASPALASRALTKIIEGRHDGFNYGSDDVAPDSFVDRAASVLSPDDVVSVPSSPRLGFLLFQFSGCRLATYDDPGLDGNDLRIRYSDLADAWDERVGGRGFRPDYIALPAGETGQRAIARGEFEGAAWVLLKLSQ